METRSGFARVFVFRIYGSLNDSARQLSSRVGRNDSGAIRADNSVCFDDHRSRRIYRFVARAESSRNSIYKGKVIRFINAKRNL